MPLDMGMNSGPRLFIDLLDSLGMLALDMAADAAENRANRNRKRVGRTRRPGVDTPLWNALVARVRVHLKKRGAKSNLAGILGVPRQRVNDYFVAGSQAPDAERTLQLLFWLIARENPGAIKPKPALAE